MPVNAQSTMRNRLLRAISPLDFDRIAPALEFVTLGLRQHLVEAQLPLQNVWFIEDGVGSVVATTAGGKQSEVGMVGCDGIVDVALINGTDATPLECFIQIPGSGWRLPSAALREASEASPALRLLLTRYAQSFLVQIAHTALANATHTIDARLARWLLMSHDRLDGDTIVMTHEFLSIMLGVRRAGVTIAVQSLEGSGLIRARRGSVIVADRAGLEQLAGDAYGTPEAEYARLFGFDFRAKAVAA